MNRNMKCKNILCRMDINMKCKNILCRMDRNMKCKNILCRMDINSVSDPDPYHLVGSGSVSGNVDMDPGSAKN